MSNSLQQETLFLEREVNALEKMTTQSFKQLTIFLIKIHERTITEEELSDMKRLMEATSKVCLHYDYMLNKLTELNLLSPQVLQQFNVIEQYDHIQIQIQKELINLENYYVTKKRKLFFNYPLQYLLAQFKSRKNSK